MEVATMQYLAPDNLIRISTATYLFAITMDDVWEWTAQRKQKWLRTVQAARYSSGTRHQSTQQ